MNRAAALKAADAAFAERVGLLYRVACDEWGAGADQAMRRFQAGLLIAVDIHERACALVRTVVAE